MKNVKEMPGPKGLPLLGSVAGISDDPLVFMRMLYDTYGDLATFHVLGKRFVVVNNPELVRTILIEEADKYPKSSFDLRNLTPYLGHGLLTNPDPDSHRQNRKLVAPAFHHKRIQGYAEIMSAQSEALLAEWDTYAGEVRDISEEMMRLTLLIVAQSIFNEPPERMAPLAHAIGDSVEELQILVDEDFSRIVAPPKWLPTPGNRRRKALRVSLDNVIGTIVDKRMDERDAGRLDDRGDLLSMLLLSTDEETGEALTREQVRDEVVTIMLAGHETTSNALTWAWYLLAQNPTVAAKLHEEVDRVLAGRIPTMEDLRAQPYTLQVFKEVLRMYPPAWSLNSRESNTQTTLGGYTAPAGTQFFISPFVMHRRADFYPEPDAFRPERWTPEFEKSLPRFAYYPFGGGARVCIGNAFAMMEGQLILAALASRYAPELVSSAQPEMLARITLSVKDGLKMRLVKRVVPLPAIEEGAVKEENGEEPELVLA